VITAVIRGLPVGPSSSSKLYRVKEGVESQRGRETEAGPSTNLYDNSDDDNIIYRYDNDDDDDIIYHCDDDDDDNDRDEDGDSGDDGVGSDGDWRMGKRHKDVESRADKEIREAEIGMEGSVEIGWLEGHTEEEYPHKELLEGGVDEEMEDVEIEAEGSTEIGSPRGDTEEGYLHEESGLEIDASMPDIDNDTSVQA
jgi:hypothetical protein